VRPSPERLEARLTPSLSPVVHDTVYPSSAVVDLQTYWQNGTVTNGTGVMIDRFHVLTAGHNIYDYSAGGSPQNPNGGFAANILVTPARTGNSAPFGTAKMVWERVTGGYAGSYMTWSANHPGRTGPGSQDIGLITLDRAIGDNTRWLGMWYFSDNVSQLQNTFGGMTVSTAGYPGAAGHPVTLQDGETPQGDTMYQEGGMTSGVSSDGTAITWSLNALETHGGQSGSPLAIHDPKGGISVVGILVGDDPTTNEGYATRISQSCYNWLVGGMQYDATHLPPQPAPAPGSVSVDSSIANLSLVSTSNGSAPSTTFTGTGASAARPVATTPTPDAPAASQGGAPALPPHISASLITRKVGKKKAQFIHVTFSDGRAAEDIRSPFQSPAVRGITVTVDPWGNVVVSGKKGKRHVTANVAV
jgi:V8-like Glu-specific endopeptidase